MFETVKMARPQKKVTLHPATLKSLDVPGRNTHAAQIIPFHETASAIEPLPVINEEAMREAYNSGMEEGRRRTTELLEQQYSIRKEEKSAHIDELLQEIQHQLKSITPALEEALFKFAVGISEHIIRQQVQANPETVISIIKEGVKKIIGVEKVKVRINPTEIQFVQERKITIQSVSESLREISFEADDGVEAGGCIIESDIGNVDARISTQLEQVKDILAKHS